MDRSSKLIPSSMASQCDVAINQLNENNKALLDALLSIDTFMNDKSILSKAFDAMRNQMSNFFTAINLLRSANLADIEDFQKLKGMLGDEELDGAKLLDMLEEAERQRASAIESLNETIISKDSSVKTYSNSVTRSFEELSVLDTAMINSIQAKIDFYDAADSQSAALFSTGANIRKTAMAVLNEISFAEVEVKVLPLRATAPP